VYAAVALLILVVALLASALPTLRATRANPLDALRMAHKQLLAAFAYTMKSRRKGAAPPLTSAEPF
jgi:hypothetical protein